MPHLLRAALVLTALLLVPTGARAHADGDPAVPNLAKEDPALQKSIEAAIEKGTKWLEKTMHKSGAFRTPKGEPRSLFERGQQRTGLNALIVYTLAHCGLGPKHKVIKKAIALLRKDYDDLYKGVHLNQATAYSLSLFVLAMHTLYARAPTEKEKADAERYGRSAKQKKNPCGYPKWVKRTMFEILDWLTEKRVDTGVWRYPGGLPGGTVPANPNPPPGEVARGPNYGGPEDLSNTQYVLLALWVGTRCGYVVEKEVLLKVAERLLGWQEEEGPGVARTLDPRIKEDAASADRYAPPTRGEGAEKKPVEDRARGFGYTPGDGVTGAMTAAGLSSLMITKAMLLEQYALPSALRTRVDQAIWDGIAWFQHNYSVKENPPVGATWHYYYLYGMERALVIGQKRFLGEHDWYPEGAKLLIAAQQEDGRWSTKSSLGSHAPANIRTPLCDTCYALLFLRRASVLPKTPVLEGPVTTETHGSD